MIMEKVAENEKWTLFLDDYVQKLEYQNVPIEMWNINKHWHRPNDAVVDLNSKLNSIIGE